MISGKVSAMVTHLEAKCEPQMEHNIPSTA